MSDPVVRYHKDEPQITTRAWWTDDKEPHRALFAVLKSIQERQASKKTVANTYHRLYTNQDIEWLAPDTQDLVPRKLTFNVVQACTDAAAAKIAKMKPRPYVVADNAVWSQAVRAKKLQKYLDGKIQEMKLYEAKQLAFVEACVQGTGAVKLIVDKEKGVMCERAPIIELFVDDLEGLYGQPQSLYQTRYVSRDELMQMFPDHERAISEAGPVLPSSTPLALHADVLLVVEAWHLAKGKRKGQHVIAIDGCTLSQEEWPFSWFPFLFDRWKPALSGFWGIGVAEELMSLQLEITATASAIEEAHRRMAVPRLIIDPAASIDADQITNEIGAIIRARPQDVRQDQGVTPHAAIYNYFDSLIQKAFNQCGISQLSATSQKPAGLNAAVAMREYQDIESERFQLVSQRYEASFVEAAQKIIELTVMAAKAGIDVNVKLSGNQYAERIKWSDVKMQEDQYIIRIMPSSLLPTTPSGRLQTVTEMAQAGMIDQATAKDLLDFPDLQAVESTNQASRRLIRKLVEEMVEEGKYTTPEPYFDLQFSLSFAQSSYLKYREMGAPDERLDLLRTFMSDVSALIAQSQPPMPAAPAGPAMPAVPNAAPTNDLLPIAG